MLSALQNRRLNDPNVNGLSAEINLAHEEYTTLHNLWVSQLQQQAKLDWMEQGDACSRLFYNSMKARMKQNQMLMLTTEEGRVLTERGQIVEHVLDFYKSLFGTEREVDAVDNTVF